ncbi:MAG: hypothetical protein MJE68_00150, partial [Proteobacteria bacterium]|nr:hypothetical protein [Pseudomonadota bacterium]
DSDDDTYEPPKRKKSVLVERIKIANALLEEHGSIINAEYGAVWTMGMLDGMHLPKYYFGEMEKN